MKVIGSILVILALALSIWRFDLISFWSFFLGMGLGTAILLLLIPLKPKQKQEELLAIKEALAKTQDRLRTVEYQGMKDLQGVQLDLQKAQEKATYLEKRTLAYQELVEVHCANLERLKEEKEHLTALLIDKERKLSKEYFSSFNSPL